MTARHLAWRLAQLLPTVLAIGAVGFLLVHIAPGDPVLALAGEHGDAEYYAFMREKFGLDRPLGEQFASYAANVARGDFGVSYVHGRPAMEVVVERVPATLLLAASALLISTVAGIALGVLAATRPGGARDTAVNVATLGLYAAPTFWVGQLALLQFAARLGWLPVHGITSAAGGATGTAHVLDVARHLALPALVLASQEIAAVARLTRAQLREQLDLDYVRTARAKGLGEAAVVLRHALRRSLPPVATIVGTRVGHVLSGAVVVEVVFGWPGIGRLLLAAMQTRNGPILLAVFLLVSLAIVIANLLTDLVYGVLDPRIRLA